MNLEKINDVAPHLTSPRRELMRGEEVFCVAGSEVSVHVFWEALVNSNKSLKVYRKVTSKGTLFFKVFSQRAVIFEIFLRALPVSPRYLKALPSPALCAGEGFREEALRLKMINLK